MATFTSGEEVAIVAGDYKKYQTGTYLRPYGWRGVMVTVLVHGENRERNLRKTSIAKKKTKSSTTASYTNDPNYNTDSHRKTSKKTITIDEDEYYDLVRQLAQLTETLKRWELKMKA